MLRGIPAILSPELIKCLMEMGHGDEIVLADRNFPAKTHAKRLVRSDGHGIIHLLKAILPFFPLDTYANKTSVAVMDVVGNDPTPEIWDAYQQLTSPFSLQKVERFAFYERAKQSYGIVATGEAAPYGNIILKKGVIVDEL
ncbi:RbsD/FucU family protein [Aureibacillus halotolerans]|uniref:L-fucose mutarotase n=1 Tax=Aureibacillus halotolerans TaxID=1508390 RepID=A0A4R6TSY3_9BACI|nr:RbsD/FucU domain-containing protein [Aureibacillus halotolerans]TDQ36431.1 L-fucose mutarotase [Aureibacillus halotolerans]